MATMTKLTTRLTPELAAVITEMRCIVRVGETPDGVEIRDARPLVEQIEAPIKGDGVVRYFGATHYIVTEAKSRQLNAQTLP